MKTPDMPKKPQVGPLDVAHAVVKGLVSAVPLYGAPAAELLSLVIVPPLQKRRDEWFESLAERLLDATTKREDFDLESLSNNEVFITTVMHASQAAIRSHRKEKLEALRNAVLNSALGNAPDEDLQLIFLNLIDTFTTWHLSILKFWDDPSGWAEKNKIAFRKLYAGSRASRLEEAFPELQGRRDFYSQVVKDLFSQGLLAVDSLGGMVTERGTVDSLTTDMGKEFLDFVTYAPEEAEES